MMGNTKTNINSIKYEYVPTLNTLAREILEIANEYYNATSTIVKDALLKEIKSRLGRKWDKQFENAFLSLTTANDLGKYMADFECFMTSKKDIPDEIIDFANKYFESFDGRFHCETKGTNLVVTRRIGIKRKDIPLIFNIDNKNVDTLYHSDWIPTFFDLFVNRQILNIIDDYKDKILDKKAKIVIEVGKAYRTSGYNDKVKNNRFINVDVNFIISIDKLDTFNLSTVSTLADIIETNINGILFHK